MKQPYLRQFICKTSITFLVIILTFGSNTISNTFAQDISPDSLLQQQTPPSGSYIEYVNEYFSIEHTTLQDGTPIEGYIINGPPEPLPEFAAERAASIQPLPSRGVIAEFPSYNWVFGCSAVSGAMIAAYYDRGAYPNMYTGTTNGGVMPLTDTSWPTWTDVVADTYPSNPLVASKNGVDGRTTRGSIDDYWVSYNSSSPDPYITNGWVQHAWGSAIGDYMKTSQSTYGSKDGSTWFYNYNSNQKLTCDTSQYYNNPDGTLGRKLFYEARGYTVTDCYNQNTDNNYVGGFSLANFQAEIDSGHPVLLNLAGHSIVGYGYSGSTIYIRDTWDSNPSNTYTMEWGGSYEDMTLLSVSVVHLASLPVNQPPTDINLSKSTVLEGQSVNTVVGTFSTVDPNAGDTFTYALVSGTGDGDNASFNISGSSLRTSAIFDFDIKNSYSIRVRSTDFGALITEKVFTISVLEVGTERLVYLPLVMRGGFTDPIINGNFELGHVAWSEYSTHGWEIIMTDASAPGEVYPHAGDWFAWLGGDFNDTSYVSQSITIPSSSPYLHYWYWIGSQDICGYDYFRVKLGSTTVQTKNLCNTTNTSGWVQGVVNLSSYVGSTAGLKFEVTTDGSANSNLFLDDVSFSNVSTVSPEVNIPNGTDLEQLSQPRQ